MLSNIDKARQKWYVCSDLSSFAKLIMAQTLEYRLEQNQAEQRRLSNIREQKLNREVYRAIRWISNKEPELADALVGSNNHEVVFKELCRVYGDKLWWDTTNNHQFLRSKYSLRGYLSKKYKYFSKDDCDKWSVLNLIVNVCFFLLLAAPPFSLFILKIYFPFLFNLVYIYLGSVFIRLVFKIVDIRYNLKWYAPICRWYSFQKKYSKQIQLLKEREKYLRTSLNLIEQVKIRRFEDDTAWFYRALEGSDENQ